MPANRFQKVAVLLGGRSAERDISLRTGAGVLAALARRGVATVAFDPAERPLEELRTEGVDAVFIALHGRFGEDGTVQGVLEWMGLPYTGSGVMASAVAMDKSLTKRIWSSDGHSHPGPPACERQHRSLDAGTRPFTAPGHQACPRRLLDWLYQTDRLVWVPAGCGPGCGARHSGDAEAFVSGREFTIGLLGGGQPDRFGPCRSLKFRPPDGRYDYQNKYFGDATRYLCPAPLSPEQAEHFQALAKSAFEAIGCEGWARVDLLWDGVSTAPMLLEINTIPGLTDHSLVPMAAQAVGVDYDELVMTILASARTKLEGASLG